MTANDRPLRAGRRVRSIMDPDAVINVALSMIGLAIGLTVGSLAPVASCFRSWD